MTPADASSQPQSEFLPRHIMWLRQYDGRRYARHLSQIELNKRIRGLLLLASWDFAAHHYSAGEFMHH
jgi:hypothetical protein